MLLLLPFTIPAPSSRSGTLPGPPQPREKRSWPSWASKSRSWSTRSSDPHDGTLGDRGRLARPGPVGGDDEGQDVVVDGLRLGDRGECRRGLAQSLVGDRRPFRVGRGGPAPGRPTARRARRSGGRGGRAAAWRRPARPAAPSRRASPRAASRAPGRSRCAAPTRRSRPASASRSRHLLRRQHLVTSGTVRGTAPRGQNSDTTMPSEDGGATGEPAGAERSPLT